MPLAADYRQQGLTWRNATAKRILPISLQSVYSFPIIVPVVQRIERRVPKGKTELLHGFAQVISRAQTALLKGVECLLCSSRLISDLPIFIWPGDTIFFFSTPMNRIISA